MVQHGTLKTERTTLNLVVPIATGQKRGKSKLDGPISVQLGQKLVCVKSLASLLAIENSWRELEDKNIISPHVFVSFDWIRAWAENYLSEHTAHDLRIYTGYNHGELVFILPLVITKHRGLKTLQWITEPIGQYGDALCARGENAADWLHITFAQIKSTGEAQIIRLRHIRKDAIIEPYANQQMVDAKYHERAPVLDLTVFKTEADYDARYTSVQRKRRKKIRKHLEDMGPVTFRQLPVGPDQDDAIDIAIREKNLWLGERGRVNRVMGCARHLSFLKTLSRANSKTMNMVSTALTAGGRPVSWELGFRYRGTHFAYITSHVNALTDLSPGRLHMDLSQRAALAAGQKAFDLMVPYDLHKESWSSSTIAANDYYVAFSLAGKIYGKLVLQTLRPLVRSVYYKMPAGVLRLLQSCCAVLKR